MAIQKMTLASCLPTFIVNPWKYKELISQLIKRDVVGRYRGSIMGLLWSFLNPILMLVVYTFFFSVVYKARWGENDVGSKFNFAITLFAGLIPFSLFSECINRAPNLITNNINYVKKVIFPLEILPIVSLGTGLFNMSVSLLVLLIFFVGIHHTLHWTIIFFPLVNTPLFLFILGISWFLSSIGVFIRDVTHSIGIFTMALLFLSPVFYSVNMLPEAYQAIINLNPLTTIIEQNRAILLMGLLPNWELLSISLICSCIVASLGYYWFQKMRQILADVV